MKRRTTPPAAQPRPRPDERSVLTEPKSFDHATAHQLFIITIIAKGMLGIAQLVTAAAIAFGTIQQLPKVIAWMFKAELAEDPHGFIVTKVMSLSGMILQSDLSFYTVYFSAHGALHLGVVAALIYGARWADFAALVTLMAFVVYQMIEWFSVGGLMLVFLTAIDLAVIYLTVIEMRRKGQWPHFRHKSA